MTSIKIECPHCQQPVELPEEDASRGINCPGCCKFFTSKIKPVEISAEKTDRRHALKNKETESRQIQLHEHADKFTIVSIFMGLSTAIAFLVLIYQVFNELPTNVSLITMCSLAGFSFWLYLIAQIIHIRANLEK